MSQFLFREARLLDARQFEDWLAMIADDVRYVAPVRLARMPREERKEFEPVGGGAHFDENKEDLAQRVRKGERHRAQARDVGSDDVARSHRSHRPEGA